MQSRAESGENCDTSSRTKKKGNSCVVFLLCDLGWCVYILTKIYSLTSRINEMTTITSPNEEVSSLQPMIYLNGFDIFPLDWGMPRRSRRVQIFL